jgi:acetyl-CoA C-acetyltransferase
MGKGMGSIKDRVAIIGMGCTKFGELWDQGVEDMLVDACYEAMGDAGIEPKDIQAGWLGTIQSGFGGQLLAHALKLEYIPVTRCENFCATGSDAFRNACYAVAAGIYDIVIAAGVEKVKDTGFSGLRVASSTVPSTGVEPPSPPPVQFALAATRYAHHHGLSHEELKTTMAKIAVKNHHNGTLCPRAHFRREITIEQAVNAPMIAWPLGLFDCCGVSDGAAAAILTTPEIARSISDDYVLVKGLALTSGAKQGQLQDWYDFVHIDESVASSKMAYQEAGIKDPLKDLDLAIVHDCFTITEMLIYEDLGFSPRGKAKLDVDAGTFSLTGDLPVNTDGGLKCFGHPIGATGLRMLYEVYKQLQGKAEERQLKKADIGLTHNLGGEVASYACSVVILGRR